MTALPRMASGGGIIKGILLLLGLAGALFGVANQSQSTSPLIRVDGRFDDWAGVPPAYSDPAGAGSAPGIDIRRVWLASSDNLLFLRFELGEEISLQSSNNLVLYLDTDDNPATGEPVNGMGADLSWSFGERTGFIHTLSGRIPFDAYDAELVTAPTVTATEFEMELRTDTLRRGVSSLFSSGTIRWLLRDEGPPPADQAPRPQELASYKFDETPEPPSPEIGLEKIDPHHLRVMTYNVLGDGLFSRSDPFSRILRTLSPDVINFQEINKHSVEATRSLIARILGGIWYAVKHRDVVILSRYPFRWSRPIDGNLSALINLPDKSYRDDLLVINAHLPSGGAEQRRQEEADAIISFIRGAQDQGGGIVLPPQTPILIMGDLNLVGSARQLTTLIAGDVVGEKRFGPDHPPDWDSTPLTDLLPYQSAVPEAYTWWRPGGWLGFGPGRLDYIIYTDSVTSVAKSFILRTESMSAPDLSARGLELEDTSTASDHLPLVADFIIKKPSPLPTALPGRTSAVSRR